MELSVAWVWVSQHWAALSGVAVAIGTVSAFLLKKKAERQMWKTLDELRTTQASNPGLLSFEPRSLSERKLYESMVAKGLLYRGRLPDHYQVRER